MDALSDAPDIYIYSSRITKKDELNIMCKGNIRSFQQRAIPAKTMEDSIDVLVTTE